MATALPTLTHTYPDTGPNTGSSAGDILLAEDNALVRETIQATVSLHSPMRARTCETFFQVIDLLDEGHKFSLIALDYNMPGMLCLNSLLDIFARTNCPVCLISGRIEPHIVEEAIKMGVVGFLPKTLASPIVVKALHQMASGETFPAHFFRGLVAPNRPKLDGLELTILQALCEGWSDAEIAEHAHLQRPTVKVHARNMMRKLGTREISKLTLAAEAYGLAVDVSQPHGDKA